MKKVLFAVIPFLLTSFCNKAIAQEDPKAPGNHKEDQEIIIRKKGDKDANISIQITGDKVIVNGKPLVEFKDDEITINKKKIIIRDGDRLTFGEGFEGLERGLENLSWTDEENESGAFLGVFTEKVDKGANITNVTEGSAASKAGLKENDIITKVGDVKIDGPNSLSDAISSKKPADEVKIYYLRDGKEKSVKVTLQKRKAMKGVLSYKSPDGSLKTITIPQSKAYADQARAYADMYRNNLKSTKPELYEMENFNFDLNSFPRPKKLGLKIQDTEDGNGVKILEVADSSAAASAGLKKDDVVTEIAGVKVANTDEAREQLMENNEKYSYNIKARRNGTEMSFDIKIPKKLKTANL